MELSDDAAQCAVGGVCAPRPLADPASVARLAAAAERRLREAERGRAAVLRVGAAATAARGDRPPAVPPDARLAAFRDDLGHVLDPGDAPHSPSGESGSARPMPVKSRRSGRTQATPSAT